MNHIPKKYTQRATLLYEVHLKVIHVTSFEYSDKLSQKIIILKSTYMVINVLWKIDKGYVKRK